MSLWWRTTTRVMKKKNPKTVRQTVRYEVVPPDIDWCTVRAAEICITSDCASVCSLDFMILFISLCTWACLPSPITEECIFCELDFSMPAVLAYLQPQWKLEVITFLQSVWQGKNLLHAFHQHSRTFTMTTCFAEGAEHTTTCLVAILFYDRRREAPTHRAELSALRRLQVVVWHRWALVWILLSMMKMMMFFLDWIEEQSTATYKWVFVVPSIAALRDVRDVNVSMSVM